MSQAGRPPPTTFEAIEAIALRTPERLAVLEDSTAWTYGSLYRDLIRWSRALERMGVRRGQRVAVAQPGCRLHLLTLIACENVGAVSAPFMSTGDPDTGALFPLVDWVLSDVPQECPAGARFLRIDTAFMEQLAAIDPQDGMAAPRIALELDEPQRLSRTSGSSGPAKFLVVPRIAQEQRIRRGLEKDGYDADSRLLLCSPVLLNASYTRACGCLRVGAAVLSVPAARIEPLAVTHLLALPIRLDELLNELPPGFVAKRNVVVVTVGGFVTPALRDRAQRAFRTRLENRYGSNEAGGICDDLDASGAGWLSAGVDLRIVDADGRDVPPGDTGMIVVRTPGMALGYLNQPQATQDAWRDGWFHTGDWGALVGPRRLRLAGRHDDVINIGGVKLAAAKLESDIRAHVQVSDCAVLAVNLAAGRATVGIVLEAPAGTPTAPLLLKLGNAIALGSPTAAQVIMVEALPRTPAGKLDRMALHRLLAHAAGAP